MEENFEVATTHNILVFPEICQKFEYIIIYRFLEVLKSSRNLDVCLR